MFVFRQFCTLFFIVNDHLFYKISDNRDHIFVVPDVTSSNCFFYLTNSPIPKYIQFTKLQNG